MTLVSQVDTNKDKIQIPLDFNEYDSDNVLLVLDYVKPSVNWEDILMKNNKLSNVKAKLWSTANVRKERIETEHEDMCKCLIMTLINIGVLRTRLNDDQLAMLTPLPYNVFIILKDDKIIISKARLEKMDTITRFYYQLFSEAFALISPEITVHIQDIYLDWKLFELYELVMYLA